MSYQGWDERSDWDIDEPDASTVECESCGKLKPCKLIRDPFIAEIYPEDDNPEQYLCRDCYDQMAGDI